jgi:hypothetical protein
MGRKREHRKIQLAERKHISYKPETRFKNEIKQIYVK